MTDRTKNETEYDLNTLITTHISAMSSIGEETPEYASAASSLKTLMEVRAIETELEKPWRPSADTVAVIGGNILGILAILHFEKLNVVTSKALGTLIRPKF